ncbi:MAG: metal ABC transporter substrate-binding protein [Anaerolineaceae bacterium]|nr:metal ABC transporter substrate-binding protein [Anaerolineaceae bacterium]
MKKGLLITIIAVMISALALSACTATPAATETSKKTIVVTYSILGSVVKELVGDQANVVVSMPDGQDPHEWEPSAKDIETLTHADMIVQNGLGLEGGMEKALAQAQEAGVKFFTASDHITIRTVGEGEGIPTGDPDQAIGAQDPHLWTDPLTMKAVVAALADQLKTDLGLDVSANASTLEAKLDAVNDELTAQANSLPEAQRKLVTGHESLGYFAQRYNFKLIGAIVPSLSTESEASAADMAALAKVIQENQTKAVFTELGTPANVAETIGKETGAKVVEITTHSLPSDGSYFTFLRNLMTVIVTNLQ